MDLRRGTFVLIWAMAIFAISAVGTATLRASPDSSAVQGGKAPPTQWARVSVQFPTSPTMFPPGEGADIADSNCLICHSAGMVLRQPPLSQDEWTAEINKMRNAYGAPLPAQQVAALAKYLSNIADARHQGGPGTHE
jgi:mono/diheme cytochrome c family protein